MKGNQIHFHKFEVVSMFVYIKIFYFHVSFHCCLPLLQCNIMYIIINLKMCVYFDTQIKCGQKCELNGFNLYCK